MGGGAVLGEPVVDGIKAISERLSEEDSCLKL